eukprot:15609921-Heterocapsa_arctica.AAC.1
MSNLKGTSWASARNDGEKLVGVRIDIPAGEEQQGALPPMSDSREAARKVHLRTMDLKTHGAKRGFQVSDAPRRGHASSIAEEVPESTVAAAAAAAEGEGGPADDSAVRDETAEGAATSSSAAKSAIEGAA